MRRTRFTLAALTLTLALALAGCDSLSDITGDDPDDGPALTRASLTGKVLFFNPDVPAGGVPNWEYQFDAGSVKGCNVENVYHSSGWDVLESENAVKVFFGPGKTAPWEQYRLVDFKGNLADGDLSGSFQYTSSPGVTMAGQFIQVSGTSYC